MENELLRKIQDSKNLIDILIVWEDILDNLDIYTFDNWMKGEILEGPNIKRYWVGVKLKYQLEDMPDPRGAKRLLSQGIKVRYGKGEEEVFPSAADSKEGTTNVPNTAEAESQKREFWIVDVNVPKRFLEDTLDAAAEMYKDELSNPEQLSSATENNITSDSTNDQAQNMIGDLEGGF